MSTTVATPRSSGSPTIPVATGTGVKFGSVFPIITTASRGTTVLAIFEVTARSTDDLTVSGCIEGTSDVDLQAGDKIEMRPTALAMTEVHDSVHALEATTAGLGTASTHPASDFDAAGAAAAVSASLGTHVADTTNPHAVTRAQVGLGSVENTAISTWAGSANVTTLGTVGTGTWVATTVAIAHGGTGATTAQAARNALLPTQTSNSGKYLTTDGTDASWGTVAGGGTTIGGAVSGGSAGRVLYEGAGPVVADDALLRFDATTKSLGVGIAPLTTLHVFDGAVTGAAKLAVDAPIGSYSVVGFWADGVEASAIYRPAGSHDWVVNAHSADILRVDWTSKLCQFGNNASGTPAAMMHVVAPAAGTVGLAVDLAGTPTVDAFQVRTSGGGSVLTAIDPTGALKLPAIADAAAPNGSLFKGSDHTNKLCFKDDSGTTHVLF